MSANPDELSDFATIELAKLKASLEAEGKRTRKLGADRKRRQYESRTKAGLVLRQLWLYPQDWHEVCLLAAQLTARRKKRRPR